MKNKLTRREFGATTLATVLASAMPAPFVWAQEKKYDPGASDTEIKLGQTVPHSGPGSLYGVLGRVGEAYFQMLNEKGGINGRKVKFFSMDDAYSAPKCVEATRRLVEQEEVLALYGSQVSAIQSVKTLTWYHDGGLEEALSVEDKDTLRRAALTFRPDTAAAKMSSSRLD